MVGVNNLVALVTKETFSLGPSQPLEPGQIIVLSVCLRSFWWHPRLLIAATLLNSSSLQVDIIPGITSQIAFEVCRFRRQFKRRIKV